MMRIAGHQAAGCRPRCTPHAQRRRSCNVQAQGTNGSPAPPRRDDDLPERLYSFSPSTTGRPSASLASASTSSVDGPPASAGGHPSVIMSRGEYKRKPTAPPGYSDPSAPPNNGTTAAAATAAAAAAATPAAAAADTPKAASPGEGGDKKLVTTINNPTKTVGLRRAPLSGGVKTATDRWALPSPPVAVRNLVEQANFAHLCTVMSNMHHRRAGYPFGTLVDFASDGAGLPIFCLSPLAIHARNIIEDSRCSLVVQMPGWTGLANARVTIFGDVYQLPQSMQDDAREIFLRKHLKQRKERWVTGNFLYFRMHRVVDIYFVGGFGTVQWIDPQEYISCQPDAIVLNDPHTTLQVLNTTFADELCQLCYPGNPADDAAFISIDAAGAEVRLRHGTELTVERIGFKARVHTREEAVAAVRAAMARL